MYTNLVLYRNELKNKTIPKYKIIGIVAELLYSKLLFPKNSDIAIFLKDVFNVEFKNYIMKSRTTIVSKIIKIIVDSDNVDYKKTLLEKINIYIENVKNSQDVKDKKNDFDGWIINDK